jgi:hypothetical protein
MEVPMLVRSALAISFLAAALSSSAFAEQVKTTTITEAAVDKACGTKIEAGCSGKNCATGCTKIENGKPVEYGCIMSSKAGKTKATCTRSAF